MAQIEVVQIIIWLIIEVSYMNNIYFKRIESSGIIEQVGQVESVEYLPEGCEQATEEEYNDFFNNVKSSFSDEYILQGIRQEKIQQMSEECSKTIQKGVQYNGKVYSLTPNDQINIDSMFNAVLAGAEEYPYHADGESCCNMKAEDILNLYVLYKKTITYYTTYYNQLKMYIDTLTDKKDVEKVFFGQELTGVFQEQLEDMMASADVQMQNIIAKLKG